MFVKLSDFFSADKPQRVGQETTFHGICFRKREPINLRNTAFTRSIACTSCDIFKFDQNELKFVEMRRTSRQGIIYGDWSPNKATFVFALFCVRAYFNRVDSRILARGRYKERMIIKQ